MRFRVGRFKLKAAWQSRLDAEMARERAIRVLAAETVRAELALGFFDDVLRRRYNLHPASAR